jgi:beta-lactamase class A
MMDFSRRKEGVENITTADDMAEVLRRLYQHRFVDASYSKLGLEWLMAQHLNDRIPAKLPKTVTVAHKTGLERSVCHDVGIVYTRKGDLLVCVLTKHKGVSAPAKRFIATLSRHAYDYLAGES